MRKPPSLRGEYSYFLQHSTRWSDNDAYGHLNNVVHYKFFDTTVDRFLSERGLMGSETIGLVVQSGCSYHAELRYPQDVVAGLRVAKIGTSSVRYELGLFASDSDEAAAEGFFVHVYVDPDTRRPMPLSEAFRAGLEAHLRA